MTNTLNKFCELSNEVDSILANVEEKIQKFEEDNNIDLIMHYLDDTKMNLWKYM